MTLGSIWRTRLVGLETRLIEGAIDPARVQPVLNRRLRSLIALASSESVRRGCPEPGPKRCSYSCAPYGYHQGKRQPGHYFDDKDELRFSSAVARRQEPISPSLDRPPATNKQGVEGQKHPDSRDDARRCALLLNQSLARQRVRPPPLRSSHPPPRPASSSDGPDPTPAMIHKKGRNGPVRRRPETRRPSGQIDFPTPPGQPGHFGLLGMTLANGHDADVDVAHLGSSGLPRSWWVAVVPVRSE